ncbi:protein FAR1-RELATED SEQUENCE 6-like [Typha angustifolia]|uniref:protein FAR1-RELATED SEQUENCE 6-like n=1 Tax=Typha angustifolia TaxID=59011 RepID=UPI003C2D3A6F
MNFGTRSSALLFSILHFPRRSPLPLNGGYNGQLAPVAISAGEGGGVGSVNESSNGEKAQESITQERVDLVAGEGTKVVVEHVQELIADDGQEPVPFGDGQELVDTREGQEPTATVEAQDPNAEKRQKPVAKKGKKAILEEAQEIARVVDEAYDGEPKLGLAFQTPEEAFRYYDRYARCAGFGIKIFSSRYLKDGTCRYLMLSCNKDGDVKYKLDYHMTKETFKTNCMARIGMMRRSDGFLHITKLITEHNHLLTPGRAKSFRSRKRKQYLGGTDDAEVASDEKLHSKESGEKKYKLKFVSGDREAVCQFLVDMQTKNSYFFYSVDLDEEGRLKNVFWADGKSRIAYKYFNDVILFDTTFLIDQFDLPLASFVGVNHHGQSVLLGCGLLSDDTAETYIWLFKTWLTCMLGHPPAAIITDRSKAMQEAVAKVFPKSHKRQCLWHIMKRFRYNLQELAGFKMVKRSFKKVVYDSMRANEFEGGWQGMVQKFGLEENEWLRSLYEDRHCWAPIFVKDYFWAGMSLTLHGECMESFFQEYVDNKTSLQQFLSNYEMIVQSKHEKEVMADHESFHKSPQLITQIYMEQQLSKVYTFNMFKMFQDEMKALTYCTPSLVKIDGLVSIFQVIEHVSSKDGRTIEQKSYEVLYNENELEVRCICCCFQFKGIICRHVLSVLTYQDVVEVPSKFIVERWRKDFKQIHPLEGFYNEVVTDGSLKHHENFRNSCLKLAEIGMISDGKYKLAVKVVNEAIQKLIADDIICERAQPETVSFDAAANCPMGSFAMNENSNMDSENLVPFRRHIVTHPQYQFFQDRVQTDQQSAGFRSGAEWGFQQYFHNMSAAGNQQSLWMCI